MNNSLAEVHPELVSEWSEKNLPLTPDDITFGSNKKVYSVNQDFVFVTALLISVDAVTSGNQLSMPV